MNDTKRDLRRELEGFDGTYPRAWKPEAGDVLLARVLGYTVAPNQFGGETRVCSVVDEATGERLSVWLGNIGLLNLFAREKPRIGERIGLKFVDTVTTKSGRPCKRFHLIVDRPQPTEPDFSPLGTEEPEPFEADELPPLDEERPPFEDEPATPYAAATMRGRR